MARLKTLGARASIVLFISALSLMLGGCNRQASLAGTWFTNDAQMYKYAFGSDGWLQADGPSGATQFKYELPDRATLRLTSSSGGESVYHIVYDGSDHMRLSGDRDLDLVKEGGSIANGLVRQRQAEQEAANKERLAWEACRDKAYPVIVAETKYEKDVWWTGKGYSDEEVARSDAYTTLASASYGDLVKLLQKKGDLGPGDYNCPDGGTITFEFSDFAKATNEYGSTYKSPGQSALRCTLHGPFEVQQQ